MKLATRINSFLRSKDYSLENVFSDFEKLGLGYVCSTANFSSHLLRNYVK